jgi:hypothetical protein
MASYAMKYSEFFFVAYTPPPPPPPPPTIHASYGPGCRVGYIAFYYLPIHVLFANHWLFDPGYISRHFNNSDHVLNPL